MGLQSHAAAPYLELIIVSIAHVHLSRRDVSLRLNFQGPFVYDAKVSSVEQCCLECFQTLSSVLPMLVHDCTEVLTCINRALIVCTHALLDTT
mgnify:CR=1 FL=1